MKKSLLITIGVVLVVGGLLAAFLVSNNDDNSDTDDQSANQSTAESTDEVAQESTEQSMETQVEGNLKTLSNDGTPRYCTMAYSGTDGEGTGKMYTDGNGRGLMQFDLTTARGDAGQSNTLITDNKVYGWTTTDGGSFGFVVDSDAIQTGSTGSPATSNSQTAGQDFSMSCAAWDVDEALLSIPSDVTFNTLPTAQ